MASSLPAFVLFAITNCQSADEANLLEVEKLGGKALGEAHTAQDKQMTSCSPKLSMQAQEGKRIRTSTTFVPGHLQSSLASKTGTLLYRAGAGVKGLDEHS